MLLFITYIHCTKPFVKDSILIRPSQQKDKFLSSRTLEIESGKAEANMFDREVVKGPAKEGSFPKIQLFNKKNQIGSNPTEDKIIIGKDFQNPDRDTLISFLQIRLHYYWIMVNGKCLYLKGKSTELKRCPVDNDEDDSGKYEWLVEIFERPEVLASCKRALKRDEETRREREKCFGQPDSAKRSGQMDDEDAYEDEEESEMDEEEGDKDLDEKADEDDPVDDSAEDEEGDEDDKDAKKDKEDDKDTKKDKQKSKKDKKKDDDEEATPAEDAEVDSTISDSTAEKDRKSKTAKKDKSKQKKKRRSADDDESQLSDDYEEDEQDRRDRRKKKQPRPSGRNNKKRGERRRKPKYDDDEPYDSDSEYNDEDSYQDDKPKRRKNRSKPRKTYDEDDEDSDYDPYDDNSRHRRNRPKQNPPRRRKNRRDDSEDTMSESGGRDRRRGSILGRMDSESELLNMYDNMDDDDKNKLIKGIKSPSDAKEMGDDAAMLLLLGALRDFQSNIRDRG